MVTTPLSALLSHSRAHRLMKICGFLLSSYSNSNCSTFPRSVCLSSSHHFFFPFSLTLPKAWFSVKYDMDGISENMIDFAACRFFYFLLDFPAFYKLSYSQERTIGHLKSELQHFLALCWNSKGHFYLCFFLGKKNISWLFFCDEGGGKIEKWQMLRLRTKSVLLVCPRKALRYLTGILTVTSKFKRPLLI